MTADATAVGDGAGRAARFGRRPGRRERAAVQRALAARVLLSADVGLLGGDGRGGAALPRLKRRAASRRTFEHSVCELSVHLPLALGPYECFDASGERVTLREASIVMRASFVSSEVRGMCRRARWSWRCRWRGKALALCQTQRVRRWHCKSGLAERGKEGKCIHTLTPNSVTHCVTLV